MVSGDQQVNKQYFGYYPATILSYDAASRTARISVEPFTKNAPEGLKAIFAYAVGEDDRKTEIKVMPGDEVWIFFESGQPRAPIIAFYRSHGIGARIDTRAIEQENIEILANANASIMAEQISLYASNTDIYSNVTIHGNLTVTGNVDAAQVTGGIVRTESGTSLGTHTHGGVKSGTDFSAPPL